MPIAQKKIKHAFWLLFLLPILGGVQAAQSLPRGTTGLVTKALKGSRHIMGRTSSVRAFIPPTGVVSSFVLSLQEPQTTTLSIRRSSGSFSSEALFPTSILSLKESDRVLGSADSSLFKLLGDRSSKEVSFSTRHPASSAVPVSGAYDEKFAQEAPVSAMQPISPSPEEVAAYDEFRAVFKVLESLASAEISKAVLPKPERGPVGVAPEEEHMEPVQYIPAIDRSVSSDQWDQIPYPIEKSLIEKEIAYVQSMIKRAKFIMILAQAYCLYLFIQVAIESYAKWVASYEKTDHHKEKV